MKIITFNHLQQHLTSLSIDQRGKEFERLCKWFLENDPRYSLQLKKVWLWKDWPGNWGRDKGIDLIAEAHNGSIWAIQVKAYDAEYYVTKEDVDTFLSETSRKTIDFRLLIATTNNIGPNAQEVISGQEKPVGLCMLNALENSELDWSPIITNTETTERTRHAPLPHQVEALSAIAKGFKNADIGQVHMACGTGKTLVGLWAAENLNPKKVLVLVPSLSLISQLFTQWSFHASKPFLPIFVCSDETVGASGYDQENSIEKASQLGLPVTTNADDLVSQLNSNFETIVVFATYHSSPVIQKACEINQRISFDIVIADEAHRCAGKAESYFATITHKESIRATKKLFMTATPKYYSENVKKKTKEFNCDIVSMDDPETFGPVFYKLPFSEAIKRELLSDYQVIIPIMNNLTYQEYIERGRLIKINSLETDARTLASQLLVAKAIKQFNLNSVISFHNRKKSATEFVSSFKRACSLLPETERPEVPFLETIFGEMPQSKRDSLLKQFREVTQNKAGLIANVKCLSEGVDVPALDGVAFIDPKGSEIDIIQSVGRAIRKSPTKSKGTIIIPIFVDSLSNEEEHFEKSCFKPIWQVIKALRAHDDTLAEELDSIRLELGKRSYKAPAKLVKIVFDVPTQINVDFSRNLQLKIASKTSWISLADSHPEIAAQWHPTKNGILAPNDVTYGSNQKVWWQCPKGKDHEWQTTIGNRQKSSCPICSGNKTVLSNCLATTHPDLALEWHPTKNGILTPRDVTFGSNLKVWWQCSKGNDHEWQTVIGNRQKTSCPVCSGNKIVLSNCLATTHPKLSLEWHSIKNGNLSPYNTIAGSGKKVWWKCPKNADHEWQSTISNRAKGIGCSVCRKRTVVASNCLATTHPELAQEWHLIKNGDITPYNVSAGSHNKAWWKCPKGDDHAWQATIDSRAKGIGCSICSNKTIVLSNCFATTHPELAKEWHSKKNGDVTPYNVSAGSHKKVWWKCAKGDDHIWQATINSRARGNGCGICANKTIVLSNCLATTHPDLAQEWHSKKNGDVTPYNVSAGSHKKVWWKCAKGDEHEWQAVIKNRKKHGCTICSGKKATNLTSLGARYPEIAQQWHTKKNGTITAYNLLPGSGKKIWWRCLKNKEHEWIAYVYRRVAGSGCPHCYKLNTKKSGDN